MADSYLHDKTLVMIVGPTAIGKSTIMHEVVKVDPAFSYAKTFTTRLQREGETQTYRHISVDEASRLYESGNTFTYITHPTTGIIYGTDTDTFVSEYTILDTLARTVDTYRSLPFERTVTISLNAEPEQWEQWLAQRFPDSSPERTKRLQEAKESILWSISQTTRHSWLINQSGNARRLAAEIIGLARGRSPNTTEVPPQATKMLETVTRLLSYE